MTTKSGRAPWKRPNFSYITSHLPISLPGDWRWYVYAPILAGSGILIILGTFLHLVQPVNFSGRILPSETTLLLEGESLNSGSLSASVDALVFNESRGAPLFMKMNSEKAGCEELKSSKLYALKNLPFEGTAFDIECNEDFATDFMIVKGLPLKLHFESPTSVNVSTESVRGISISSEGRDRAVGGDKRFLSSLQVGYEFDSDGAGRELSQDCFTSNGVVLDVNNRLGDEVGFFSSVSTSTTPWKSLDQRKDLCIVFEYPGDAGTTSGSTPAKSRFTLAYTTDVTGVKGQYVSDSIRLSQSIGQLGVVRQNLPLLGTDCVEVQGTTFVPIIDDVLSFRVSGAHLAEMKTAPEEGKCYDDQQPASDGQKGENIRRSWIDTWPPYYQAIVAVVASGLGVQIALRFLLPLRLRSESSKAQGKRFPALLGYGRWEQLRRG